MLPKQIPLKVYANAETRDRSTTDLNCYSKCMHYSKHIQSSGNFLTKEDMWYYKVTVAKRWASLYRNPSQIYVQSCSQLALPCHASHTVVPLPYSNPLFTYILSHRQTYTPHLHSCHIIFHHMFNVKMMKGNSRRSEPTLGIQLHQEK